ncbi:two-component regulator propeller domain-containing protein [Niastella sp. OAS944]|uniref:hybrid sensor histidine kinase/response regulator transcription factor n=1 Tax=Niastella sp. OAS944 TaxID=2664089 RepID=UPI0035C83061|nr:signal transduction histidine kinase/ligand-binding sensor domain-containing protein/AraC-like DNA-binding protein/ActR/RegA family two-component response regulator [Chitinophagaceae bacterium OAS944]
MLKAAAQPKCKVEYYSTEQGLSHQAVTCMLKDREGFMWFGTWDGINRFDGHSFLSFKSLPGDHSRLGNGRVDQIVEDQSDHLWIQAYDRQIYRFDKKSGQFAPLSPLIDPEDKQKINFSRILSAGNGWVWLQSVNEGLFCVSQNDLSTKGVVRYNKASAHEYQLPANAINFFHEDHERLIWIGTPEGLACLAPSGPGIYTNSKIASLEMAGRNDFTAFDEDAGCLYFGTADGHLFIYEKKTRSFSVRKVAASRLNALLRSKKSDCIYTITNAGELISCPLKDGKNKTVSYRRNEPLTNLYEDKKGILWIAPEKEGVLRFDPAAMSFNYYFHENIDRLNVPRNPFSVFEDNNGVTWVYMKGGGFGYYNDATRSLNYILQTPDAGSASLPATCYRVFYDSTGLFWLTTNERQLIRVLLQSNVFEQQLLVGHPVSKFDNEIRGMYYDNKNRLWLGAKNGKVYLYQHGKRLTGVFDNEPAEGPGQVYAILQDSRGNMWLGTKGNGLYKAAPVNKEETKYHLIHYFPNKANANNAGLPCNDIYALLEDRRARIWIGSFDKGLFQMQGVADSIQFVQSGDAFRNYPQETFNKIRHLALDSTGNIWIGTTNGLLLLNADDRNSPVYGYTPYRKIPGDGQSLGNNDIQFIYRDSKNHMWLSTSGGGFCRAVGNQPFRSLRFKNYTTKDGMPNNYVLGCTEDRAGNLWIATENGLSRFNPHNESFRNYDSYYGLARVSFSEAAVCRSSDGRLFYGSNRGYITFDPNQINNNNDKRIAANIVFTALRINNEKVQPGLNALLKEDINYLTDCTLQHDQNIISIDYAILDNRLGNRQALVYRLLGFDSVWHDDGLQGRATYTNLPPGQYVFEVKSSAMDLYSNVPYRRLAITILPPLWKTWWAYLLYAILIGLILVFIRRNALAMVRLRNKIAVEQKLAVLKADFFTNVSHELRTPLTLIVNPIEQLAKKENLSSDGAAYVEVAKKNAGRMMRFINQLLDLRKIESNKATLHISRLEIISFVTNVGEHFRVELENRGIQLDIMSEQQELIAWADAEKLDVVIFNLLANAVKFTPEGKKITIIVRSLADENCFTIEVRDQGPGVDKEKLKQIFELFYEGDQPPASGQKGSGIGLALCRELAHLHGGSIYAANNAEGGLSVTVKLKLGNDHYKQEEITLIDGEQASPQYQAPPVQPLLRGQANAVPVPVSEEAPLLLLVEDNDDLRAFLEKQLSERYRVVVAPDGAAGCRKAIQLMPDVIVSDIMMPVMDGIQMLDKIKNDINTSHIPVVLLSARHSIESQIEGLRYGADHYITKPFNNEFLFASIDNLLQQRKKLFDTLVNKKTTPELITAPLFTTGDENFLKEVIAIVEEKMTDPGFTLEMVAGDMKMSRSTFYKKFKSLTGIMPVEFVRDMRLLRAKRYLDAGSTNIGEVAYLSGFSSPKYFSTCFREKYQLTPSEYIKSKDKV